ncbi:MAG: hypothetical protein BMS9Abin04_477 [Planctomycetia bacterium]|nr:MAG: hypothetical protein BMS9Abin04_477 [Planctomycetia bacterium]
MTLCAMALGGYLLFYGVGVLLAHLLGAAAYGDYCVAVASVTLAVAVSTVGLEKLALRALPAYVQRQEWSLAHGFWRFGLGVVLSASIVVSFLVIDGEALANVTLSTHAEARVLVFLPAIGLFLLMLEVATAAGAPLWAAFVYRLVLPGILLGTILALARSPWEVTAPRAATCYGCAWIVALGLMYALVRRTMPAPIWSARSRFRSSEWFTGGLPYMVNSLLLTLLAQSSVIVLELVRPLDPEVAIYAAAAQTGSFIVLTATSTNRFYLPRLSVLIERGDTAGIRAQQRQRLVSLGSLCGVFLGICVGFGRAILGLFGAGFDAGYAALCLIAAANTTSTILALKPYYLQFVKYHRQVVGITALVAVVNAGACVPLAYRYGALGAAVAYAVSMIGMHVIFYALATRDLQRRERL